MGGDALWYEAAQVAGITNALNVVADGLGGVLPPVSRPRRARGRAVYDDIREFYGPAADEIPIPFGLVAQEPGYLADLWVTVKHAFTDNCLSRRVKTALAFAVSLTSRSDFGTASTWPRCVGWAWASAGSWRLWASPRCSRRTRRSPTPCSWSRIWATSHQWTRRPRRAAVPVTRTPPARPPYPWRAARGRGQGHRACRAQGGPGRRQGAAAGERLEALTRAVGRRHGR